jgi:hypothetical protein
MSSQYYSATAYVGTPHRNEVEVTIPLVGPAGPQGPAGSGGGGDVESVNGQTGVVVLAAADVGAASTSHAHGNLTNAGAIGTTSGLPVKTGTSGVLEAGAFGTAAGQFAEGNHTHALSAITDAGTAAAQDANQDLGTSDQVTFQGVTVNGPPVNEIYPGEGVVNCGKLNLDTYAVDLGGGSTGDGFPSIVFGAINGGITLKGPEGDITTSKVINIPNASGTLALNPMTTAGDLFVGGTSGTPARLALGTASQQLRVNSGATSLEYFTPAAGGTKTYAVFTATDNQPPATAFATLDTRNSIAVLDFDDASTKSAVFVGILPEAASLGSGLIVSLRWMATTATSGDVRWSVAWEKSNTDLDSDSFDTATAATATANGTSGIVTVTNITCTTIDSLAAGDLFRLRVQRIGGDGADTMTGDAELVAVEIRSAA